METTKLTLSASPALVRNAKRLAAKQQTSVSEMFARFVTAISRFEDRKTSTLPPVTRRATGIVRLPAGRSSRKVLEDSLAEKYGVGK